MTKIIVEHFCGLSGNPVWQNWLYTYDAQLYQQLVTHLRAGQGCARNRTKMAEIMAEIVGGGGQERLFEFLQQHFPAVLERGEIQPVESLVRAVPFTISAVNLPTFPRRTIIENTDPIALHEAVREFTERTLKHQHVVLGHRAYIEYVPVSGARWVDQVPEKNWLIAAFRRSR